MTIQMMFTRRMIVDRVLMYKMISHVQLIYVCTLYVIDIKRVINLFLLI